MSGAKHRRGRAREAKRAARAQGPTSAEPPVYRRLTGGDYRPLSDHDLRRIHEAALDVLARIGMAEPIPRVQELALAKGCHLNKQGRLRFPASFSRSLAFRCPHGCVP